MAEGPSTPPAQASRTSRRRTGLLVLSLLFVAAAVGWGAWWILVGSHYVSTDNAYAQGNVVQVTPQVAGTVLTILADDTDLVREGQPLVTLDPADARVALEQAQAQLGQTVREVRVAYATNATLASGVAAREAELARVRTDVARAEGDLRRREQVRAGSAVSVEEVQHARDALESARSAQRAAQAGLAAAREQLATNRALTDGTTVEKHPNVLRAAARVREAWLALARTTIPAPVTGYVNRRIVQVGQRVQAGAPLLAIAPPGQMWVDANFKESQLRDVRIGQPVRLTADLYGDRMHFDGRVAGLSAGTGAAFALLPAQNATGNWIKVVQRVPVRIALDPKQLAEHPLRVGLSMQAEIDVLDRSGPVLAQAPRETPVARTTAYESAGARADDDVRRIVRANLAQPASGR
jgi:membrane fusion protein, multidrug efflux system